MKISDTAAIAAGLSDRNKLYIGAAEPGEPINFGFAEVDPVGLYVAGIFELTERFGWVKLTPFGEAVRKALLEDSE